MPPCTSKRLNGCGLDERLQGLRLALVGPMPPPHGGMAMQTRQLSELFAAEGMTVRLVAVNPPYRPTWIRHWRGVRAFFRLLPYLRTLWKVAGEAQVLHVMANSWWSWHLFAAPAIWIGQLRGTPVLVNFRGGEAAAFLERELFWVGPSLRRASLIVVPSAYLREVFARFGIEAEIIPNCVDTQTFRPRPAHAGASGGPHLLVARHLEPIYDVATAIRAFCRLKEHFSQAELTVAGTGKESQPLRNLTTELGISAQVHFTGSVDRPRMVELYRQTDLLLNPSLEDNAPNSLLEAMATGVPVVSTDAGGIPLLIAHEENGLMVRKGDAEAMAQAAMRVLRDGSLRARLVNAGLETARRHAWPQIRRHWLDAYARLARD